MGMWNLPPRNTGFIGRDQLLSELRNQLYAARPAVRALHGIPGVGKTQLAVEYAWRFASDYDLVWWIHADTPDSMQADLAMLADLTVDRAENPALTARRTVSSSSLVTIAPPRRQLLIFDNAWSVRDVQPFLRFLPAGAHVLITARTPARQQIDAIVPLRVPMLERAETVALLRRRIGDLDGQAADRLAALVGDYPPAAVQIAASLGATAMIPNVYLQLFTGELARLATTGSPHNAAPSIGLSTDRLAGLHLLQLATSLDPDTTPSMLFIDHPEVLDQSRAEWLAPDVRPRATAKTAIRPLAIWTGLPREVQRTGPTHLNRKALIVHQLVHAALPDRITGRDGLTRRATMHAVRTIASTAATTRALTLHAAYYLEQAGYPRAARRLADQALTIWTVTLGRDHPDTLAAAHRHAVTQHMLGEYPAARTLFRDTVARRRRLYGDGHPDTLASTIGLAAALRGLGDHPAARALFEDTLARRRRLYDDDHPGALASTHSFAVTLHVLGEYLADREMFEDMLVRRRSDHLMDMADSRA
jgi:hypothetical protein